MLLGSNFVQLSCVSLRSACFCYMDVKKFKADSIFVRKKMRVKFLRHACNDKNDYVIVVCKILKKDIDNFVEAMTELKNNMLLCGHTDYLDECKTIFGEGD